MRRKSDKRTPMEIKSLADTGFEALFRAFSAAFADYEMQLNETQLRRMLKRRGFNPRLSFAAFDGDRIAAFTLNGIGTYDSLPTAYDTGTGTLEAYRGQGLATRIFEHSIPYLKEAGIGRYLLEVLQHNTKAVSVYRKLGFEVIREFNYFSQEREAVDVPADALQSPYTVRRIDTRDCEEASGFWDFRPSWQNSFDAIARSPEDFVSLGAFAGERSVGYCVFEPASGDITQLAVDKGFRGRGVGSRLLGEALRLIEAGAVKVVNTDAACESVTRFLERRRIPVRGQQFEMIRTL